MHSGRRIGLTMSWPQAVSRTRATGGGAWSSAEQAEGAGVAQLVVRVVAVDASFERRGRCASASGYVAAAISIVKRASASRVAIIIPPVRLQVT